jgi:simple sugar transport system permease protein
LDKLPFLDRFRLIERRMEPIDSVGQQLALIFIAVLFAFALGSLFFLPFDANPIQAYRTLVVEGFGDLRGIGYTLVQATPIILIGLGTVVAFRSGYIYLGFEGAMSMGAIAGVWFALECGEGGLFGPLPWFVFFPLVVVISFVVGGLWSAIVGLSKAKLGGNEVIISLMSNYVALFIANFLVSGPMRNPGDQPQTPHIPNYTRFPFFIPDTRAHVGILIAIGCVILVYLMLRKTPLGYRLIVTGAAPRAARYSGIQVARIIIVASFIAGGLAGLAGAVEVLGVQFRVTDGITGGLGFTGIVAALLGRLEPIGVGIAAILYAGMGVGADAMQRRAGVPTSVVYTIQGLVVMLVFVFDFFRYYRVVIPEFIRAADRRKVTE